MLFSIKVRRRRPGEPGGFLALVVFNVGNVCIILKRKDVKKWPPSHLSKVASLLIV